MASRSISDYTFGNVNFKPTRAYSQVQMLNTKDPTLIDHDLSLKHPLPFNNGMNTQIDLILSVRKKMEFIAYL